MLEMIVAYATIAAPYVLVAIGILICFLGLARLTAKAVIPMARS